VTIIVGINLGTSVVLAADQLRSGPPSPDIARFITKVVRHPSQPLAVATTGEAFLMRPGSPSADAVEDLVKRAFVSAQGLDLPWTGHQIADALASELHPRLLDTAARGGISVGGPGTGLTLFIAAAKQGRGELLRLCMRRDVELKAYEFDGGEPIKASMPDEVQPNFFERQPMRDLRALYAEAYPLNADVAAQHASDVIHEVIAFEASLHDGQNIKIGGHADVAIVDDHGTRWWLNEEAKRRLRNKNKKEKTRSKR
jgi:hypothetical protein